MNSEIKRVAKRIKSRGMNTEKVLSQGWTVCGVAPKRYYPIAANAVFGMNQQLEVNDPGFSQIKIPAKVPGTVHLALQENGYLPDLFHGDRVEQALWVEQWDWTYETDFEWEKGNKEEWVDLVFEGLDTVTEIELNGNWVAKTENMFHPHSFEVTSLLKKGRNRLKLFFPAHRKTIEGKPLDQFVSVFATDRVFTRKMQCAFGWDWVPRLVSVGPWKPIRLVRRNKARIVDVHLRSWDLTEKNVKVQCAVQVENRTSETLLGKLTFRDPEGKKVVELKATEREGQLDFEGGVENPEWWWPNGHGKASLYSCELILLDAKKAVIEEREWKHGFKSVRIEEIPDARGASFTLVVNGRRIFAQGANWVPADPFPASVTKERYDHLLGLAQEAGCNMIRGWGGGIYEKEAFWEACDRLGLMVMQDFAFGCAQYPERDLEFRRALEREFSWVIRYLRPHASLILWCGDNEGGMNQPDDVMYPGRIISKEISEPLCALLDPDRPFIPTSPFRGKTTNNSEDIGDCHLSFWWNEEFLLSDMKNYRERAEALSGRFYSEAATMGSVSYRTLLKFMTQEEAEAPDKRVLELHTRNCEYGPSRLDPKLTFFGSMEKGANLIYGESKSRRELIGKMAYLHYEVNRLTIESLRRRLWDCSGILFWMYNDCWPALGWANVDYYGVPKAGWYAMKNAFRPVTLSTKREGDQLQVTLSNISSKTVQGKVRVRFQPWVGKARIDTVTALEVSGLNTVMIDPVNLSLVKRGEEGIWVFDWSSRSGEARTLYYAAGMPGEMKLPQTRIQVKRVEAGDREGIEICATSYARVVTLEGDALFSDNYFDLIPGEKKRVEWKKVPQGKGKIELSAWNSPLQTVN